MGQISIDMAKKIQVRPQVGRAWIGEPAVWGNSAGSPIAERKVGPWGDGPTGTQVYAREPSFRSPFFCHGRAGPRPAALSVRPGLTPQEEAYRRLRSLSSGLPLIYQSAPGGCPPARAPWVLGGPGRRRFRTAPLRRRY